MSVNFPPLPASPHATYMPSLYIASFDLITLVRHMHLCYAERINVGVNALFESKTETGM